MTRGHGRHEDLIRAYEARSADRDARQPSGFKAVERDLFADALIEVGAKSVIEIGCGPGHDAKYFKDRGFEVTAVDATPSLIALAQAKGIDARLLDVRDLGSLSASFEAVYSMNCLLHVTNDDLPGVLRSIHDVMTDGGLFYLGTWGGDDFEGVWEGDSYEPKRFFSLRRARTLLNLV